MSDWDRLVAYAMSRPPAVYDWCDCDSHKNNCGHRDTCATYRHEDACEGPPCTGCYHDE